MKRKKEKGRVGGMEKGRGDRKGKESRGKNKRKHEDKSLSSLTTPLIQESPGEHSKTPSGCLKLHIVPNPIHAVDP